MLEKETKIKAFSSTGLSRDSTDPVMGGRRGVGRSVGVLGDPAPSRPRPRSTPARPPARAVAKCSCADWLNDTVSALETQVGGVRGGLSVCVVND